tara:strand:- start:454 stop:819 length:366 start_codon:yes stop_codon:yes gene_type:complete
MTNLYPNPTVQAFLDDLDENVVFKDVWSCVDFNGAQYRDIHIDFINPVTGSICQAQFEMTHDYELLRIFYIIDSNKDKIHEELEMEDLNDLYEFILMDEENSPAEVSDLWADEKGGQNMTI